MHLENIYPIKENVPIIHYTAQSSNVDFFKAFLDAYCAASNKKASDALITINDFDKGTVLHTAALYDNSAVVEYILSLKLEELNPNSPDEDAWTPLHFACLGGSVKSAKLLLEKGASLKRETTRTKNKRTFSRQKSCFYPSEIIPQNNKNNPVQVWLKRMLLPTEVEFRQRMFEYTHDWMDLGIPQYYSISVPTYLIHYSAFLKNTDVLKELKGYLSETEWSKQLNTIKNQTTPLIEALKRPSSEEVIRWLVENGADVNQGSSRKKPIQIAIEEECSLAVIELLIKAGADVSVKDSMNSSLHALYYRGQSNSFRQEKSPYSNFKTAIEEDDLKTIKAMVEENSTWLSYTFLPGEPVLFFAFKESSFEVVEWLLEQEGIELDQKDSDDNTLMHVAATKSEDHIAFCLQKALSLMVKNKYFIVMQRSLTNRQCFPHQIVGIKNYAWGIYKNFLILKHPKLVKNGSLFPKNGWIFRVMMVVS